MLLAVVQDRLTQLPDGEGDVRTRPGRQVHKTADGFAVRQRIVALVALNQLQAFLQRRSDPGAHGHPERVQHLRSVFDLRRRFAIARPHICGEANLSVPIRS